MFCIWGFYFLGNITAKPIDFKALHFERHLQVPTSTSWTGGPGWLSPLSSRWSPSYSPSSSTIKSREGKALNKLIFCQEASKPCSKINDKLSRGYFRAKYWCPGQATAFWLQTTILELRALQMVSCIYVCLCFPIYQRYAKWRFYKACTLLNDLLP